MLVASSERTDTLCLSGDWHLSKGLTSTGRGIRVAAWPDPTGTQPGCRGPIPCPRVGCPRSCPPNRPRTRSLKASLLNRSGEHRARHCGQWRKRSGSLHVPVLTPPRLLLFRFGAGLPDLCVGWPTNLDGLVSHPCSQHESATILASNRSGTRHRIDLWNSPVCCQHHVCMLGRKDWDAISSGRCGHPQTLCAGCTPKVPYCDQAHKTRFPMCEPSRVPSPCLVQRPLSRTHVPQSPA